MTARLPLVLDGGCIERLDANDTLSVGAWALPNADPGAPPLGNYTLYFDDTNHVAYWDSTLDIPDPGGHTYQVLQVNSFDTGVEWTTINMTEGYNVYVGATGLASTHSWTYDGTDYTLASGHLLKVADFTATRLVYATTNGALANTDDLTYDGTDFTVAAGSTIKITDFTANNSVYATANGALASTNDLTYDGTNFTLDTGSALKCADVLMLCPLLGKAIQVTTDGDARGTYAVDLQSYRSTSSQVASGSRSMVLGGRNNTASATGSIAFGYSNTSSGTGSLALGGTGCVASSNYGGAIGLYAKANKYGQLSHASGQLTQVGDAQQSWLEARIRTTNNTPAELFLDGATATERITLDTTTAWHFTVKVIAQQTNSSYSVARYTFEGIIARTGSGNATIRGTTTKTEDEEDATWDFTVTADTTNQSLKLEATGAADQNITWVAAVHLVQVVG